MARRLKKPYRYIFYGTITILVGLLLFLLIRMIVEFAGQLIVVLEKNDREALMNFLSEQSEFSGLLTLYFMSILQVASIVLPGMLVQVSGALVYGWWKSFIACWLGFVSGNVIVFIAARIMGRSVTDALNLDLKGGWLVRTMNRKNPAFVTALACMIPGIPNGIIPYIAARSKLYVSEFAKSVALSCWLQILLNCIAGHFLVRGQYIFTIFAFLLQIVILFVLTKNRDKILNAGS